MKVEEMIKFVRKSVYVQDPTSATQDKEYLSMTDEDLLSYMNMAMSRNFSDTPSLEYLPEEDVYGLVLLTKKDLYLTLAVRDAPLYDMGADNNNYIKRSQRFEHYMALAKLADEEFSSWLQNGGDDATGTVTSYSVTLSDRYNTRYNYENAAVPKVKLYIPEVTNDSVTITWSVKNISRFFCYKVFVSKEKIVDLANAKSHISESALCVQTIKDIHQTSLKITGLDSDSEYHVAVQATNMATLTGYAESTFTTSEQEE